MAQLYITSNTTNKHREEDCVSLVLLHYAAKGNQAGCISYIESPDPICNNTAMYEETITALGFQYPWKDIDDSNDIMDRLLTCNKLHLHQAWETPFATGPLK
eukprot:14460475-Ditylum_brightwellii.AAC.1